MPSKRFRLSKVDAWKIVQVILWSGVAAMLTTTIALLQEVEIPEAYVFLVPVINTVLYAALKFVNGRKG